MWLSLSICICRISLPKSDFYCDVLQNKFYIYTPITSTCLYTDRILVFRKKGNLYPLSNL